MSKEKRYYAIMTLGAALGTVAAFWQTLEKLTLLKNKDAILSCNLSSVFSCTNVLTAKQSSVFGFPNSIMCMALFLIFFSVALVLLTGGMVARGMRLAIQFLSLFTLGFALWFLFQSTYRIGAICIFCVFCFIGLLMVNWGWLRVNSAALPLSKTNKNKLQKFISSGADTFLWVLIGLVVSGAILLRFYV